MKSTRLVLASLLLLSIVAEAAVVVHNSGVTTYTQRFGNDSEITVNGGEATFTRKIGRRSIILVNDGDAIFQNTIDRSSSISIAGGEASFAGNVNRGSSIFVTGGIALFTGTIQRNSTLDLSGGSTVLTNVGNNAIISLSGVAQLDLTGSVGSNASLDIRDNAQMTISGPNMFSGISEFTATGGSIDTNGYDFSADETVLSGLTVVDLGGGSNAVDLGTLSGVGQMVFTNFNPDTEVYFSAFGGFDPGTQLIFDGVGSQVFDGYVTPVPEPEMASLIMLLVSGAVVYFRRQRQNRK